MKNNLGKRAFYKKFRQHRLASIALILLALEIVAVVVLPFLYTVDPVAIDATAFSSGPSVAHPLGTDTVGRDLLARVLYGGRVSLGVGFGATCISILIGVPLGLIAGYFRGISEILIMRAADICMAIPTMILALVVVSITTPSVWIVTVIIGVLGWTSIARLLYANVLSVRNSDYVDAARAIGTKNIVILLQYVLPNSIAPLWMNIAFRISSAIMTESALSFLGAGVQPPDASWGNIISVAKSLGVLQSCPWLWIAPGICLLLTIVCINLVGEGVRDALDPKMKR